MFGHEGAGTIKAIGSQVKNKDLKVGDFVLLSINYCEECRFCTSGQPANCTQGTRLHLHGLRPDGSTAAKLKGTDQTVRSHFFGQSSFAKTMFVQETCVVKCPYPPEEAGILASMGCGYQTGGCNDLQVRRARSDAFAGAGTVMNVLRPAPDSSLVVFGLGTVGLTAVMAAKYLGVKQIIAIDIQPSKFAVAKEVGATETVNSRDVPDIVKHIKELTGGAGADFAIDCVGRPAVIEAALNCTGM